MIRFHEVPLPEKKTLKRALEARRTLTPMTRIAKVRSLRVWLVRAMAALTCYAVTACHSAEPASKSLLCVELGIVLHEQAGAVCTPGWSSAQEPLYVALPRTPVRVRRVFSTQDDLGQPAVGIELHPMDVQTLADFTRTHVGERMVIVIDGKVAMDATIQEPLTAGQFVIQGRFTESDCQAMIERLSASP
jgi:hypothetical protein